MKKLIAIMVVLSPIMLWAQMNNPGYQLDLPDKNYGTFINVFSPSMNTEFPALVFVPDGYTSVEQRFPVVYMLHGTNDMPLTEEGLRKMYNPATRVQEMAEMFNIIIVAPLVGNSYYLDAPVKKGHTFATFIGVELTGYMDKNYRTIANRDGRILCGFSMGGYGSVSLLCRYPDVFSVSLARAGVIDLATAIKDLYWDEVGDNVELLLGDYYSNGANYHLNNCFNLVNHIRHRKDIAFVIEVGKDDFLFKTNFAFHEWLNELNMPHIYTETEGGHEWNANALRSLLSNLQYFKTTQFN
jgi:S-formylglutathione hydrolase FrmB